MFITIQASAIHLIPLLVIIGMRPELPQRGQREEIPLTRIMDVRPKEKCGVILIAQAPSPKFVMIAEFQSDRPVPPKSVRYAQILLQIGGLVLDKILRTPGIKGATDRPVSPE